MAAEAEGEQVPYHARLDRTPEPRAFQHLNQEDKRMICNLRTVVSGARDKFSKLRDEVDNKDKLLDREIALRKELEERLQERLVNIYNDESVNEELRQRLPRANKSPNVTLNGNGPERSALDDIDDEITATDVQQQESALNGHWDEDDIDGPDINGRSPTQRSPNRTRRGRRDRNADEDYHPSYERSRSERSPRRYHDHPPHVNYPGYYPAAPPYMPMYSYAPPPTPHPPAYMMPAHMGPTPTSGFSPMMQSTPMHNTDIRMNHDQIVPNQTQTASPGRGNQNPGAPGSRLGGLSRSGAAGSNLNLDGAGASDGGVLGAGDSSLGSADAAGRSMSQISGVDPHRQITLLLAELDRLREKNKKLNEEIIDLQRQLASLSASSETRDKEVEAKVAAKVADVIEEIYQAQKQRDAAMMQRLRLANEERDEAVMRVKKMQADGGSSLPSEYDDLLELLDAEGKVEEALKSQKEKGLQKIPERLVPEERVSRAYSSPSSQGAYALPDEPPVQRSQRQRPLRSRPGLADDLEDLEEMYDPDESTIENMLQKLNAGDSFQDIGKEGDILCSKLTDARKRKKRITVEEMKAILEERDAALVKMKRMEQELSKLQRQGYSKQAPDNNEQALRAKLLAITQERDMALAKVQRLEDEMQTLRVYYSLHKSLSQEANLRDQFNNTLENITVQLKERDGNIELAQKENNILLAQLKALTVEKNDLAEQLGKLQLSKQEADATVEKLQRLVKVLRRKINGADRAD